MRGNVFCAHRITKCESEKGFERGLKWHTPRTRCIYFQVDGVSAVYTVVLGNVVVNESVQ